jgi:hypothetical protein
MSNYSLKIANDAKIAKRALAIFNLSRKTGAVQGVCGKGFASIHQGQEVTEGGRRSPTAMAGDLRCSWHSKAPRRP